MLKIISMVIDNYYRFRYYNDVASFVLLRSHDMRNKCIWELNRKLAPIKLKSKVTGVGLF